MNVQYKNIHLSLYHLYSVLTYVSIYVCLPLQVIPQQTDWRLSKSGDRNSISIVIGYLFCFWNSANFICIRTGPIDWTDLNFDQTIAVC